MHLVSYAGLGTLGDLCQACLSRHGSPVDIISLSCACAVLCVWYAKTPLKLQVLYTNHFTNFLFQEILSEH